MSSFLIYSIRNTSFIVKKTTTIIVDSIAKLFAWPQVKSDIADMLLLSPIDTVYDKLLDFLSLYCFQKAPL